jgi:hypothetical protein
MRQARGRLEVAVQDKRIEVGAVGPHDRPQLIIHTNLREEARVSKRLEHGTVQLPGEIDIARTAVAEAEPQPIVAENLDRRDPHEVHDPILRQRVDRLRRATVLRPPPVRLQLPTMQRRPLAHELERTTRQLARTLGDRLSASDKIPNNNLLPAKNGEGGIRTPERGYPRYAISSRARSTAPAPLRVHVRRSCVDGGMTKATIPARPTVARLPA